VTEGVLSCDHNKKTKEKNKMKFVLTVVKYLVLINLVVVGGTLLLGREPVFNLITNVTVPVICAVTEWEMKGKKTADR
jgi:hypothetical protein